jgi:Ca2+/Na+ antiporter
MTSAHIVRAILGGAVGAILGYAIYAWLVGQGFYALAIPGAALGLGCGLTTRRSSLATGLACGVLGVLLGLLSEGRFFPFVKDNSLSYFISHASELKPVTWIMMAVGGIFAAYFGLGRDPKGDAVAEESE